MDQPDLPGEAVKRLALARGITAAAAAEVLRRSPEALAQIRAELAAGGDALTPETIQSEPFARQGAAADPARPATLAARIEASP